MRSKRDSEGRVPTARCFPSPSRTSLVATSSGPWGCYCSPCSLFGSLERCCSCPGVTSSMQTLWYRVVWQERPMALAFRSCPWFTCGASETQEKPKSHWGRERSLWGRPRESRRGGWVTRSHHHWPLTEGEDWAHVRSLCPPLPAWRGSTSRQGTWPRSPEEAEVTAPRMPWCVLHLEVPKPALPHPVLSEATTTLGPGKRKLRDYEFWFHLVCFLERQHNCEGCLKFYDLSYKAEQIKK